MSKESKGYCEPSSKVKTKIIGLSGKIGMPIDAIDYDSVKHRYVIRGLLEFLLITRVVGAALRDDSISQQIKAAWNEKLEEWKVK